MEINGTGKTSSRGDVFVPDELVPFDLQQLPLTLRMKGPSRALESVERRDQVLAAYKTAPGHSLHIQEITVLHSLLITLSLCDH